MGEDQRRQKWVKTSATLWSASEVKLPLADRVTEVKCLASRVTLVRTALRNFTGDEGGPFGFGDQIADPKPP
jgi:hypothetical protein